MAEHDEIINATGLMVRAAGAGDAAAVREAGDVVARLLHPHTQAEEVGLFSVMREQDEFTEHIDVLCGEHVSLDGLLEAVVRGEFDRAAEFEKALRTHIDKEDNGLFPAAAMSLDGPEWERVDASTPPEAAALTDGRGHRISGTDHAHPHGQGHDHDHGDSHLHEHDQGHQHEPHP
jgi:hypothetical protein